MTRAFFERVRAELTVDTRKYRYNYRDKGGKMVVERIELNKLDTTEALTGWETVDTKEVGR